MDLTYDFETEEPIVVVSCIESKRALNSSGYPVMWKDGKSQYEHRVIAGAKPGQVVRHICDNPCCINPDHLVLGTAKDNSLDMVNKMRQAYGEKAGNSYLTVEQVNNIRKYKGILSSRKVASLFETSKTNVLDIWNNKTWRYD